MVAVKAGDVDRAVASRRSDIGLLLFYGPDAGRVTERARAAAQAAVSDPSDPFQLIRIDGDALAEAPARLVEEASTFGMFGGRRAIWVRPSGRNIAPAVTACLDVPLVDTLVVIEAGDLAKSSPLRAACEASPRALALPCYADEGRDLAAVIAETLRAQGLAIDPDAREFLAESLGGDRLATRGELEKLALYAHGQSSVRIEDVEAVVSDVSGPSVDAVIDAAFLGDRTALEAGLEQLSRHGTVAAAIVALALRHGLALLGQVVRLGGGGDVETAIRNWRGLHFRRRNAVARQLKLWTPDRLTRAIAILQSAALTARQTPALADAAAAQALFALGSRARSASAG
ncbi:DNA polymerase III subunit delta [Enterovirga aerilata]|uniref:DNA-directed DNA polymerase n=1 Tax=Enterovirga aerilata TaxID=2730920 RepID=A0A849I8H8_9HYPH|nr:DNA polymerase III subunit delta [Enterovirga sp. DB1703]NNM73698.1 DNA polymerase III subunit delta [Enterovirga sp. DB1703]